MLARVVSISYIVFAATAFVGGGVSQTTTAADEGRAVGLAAAPGAGIELARADQASPLSVLKPSDDQVQSIGPGRVVLRTTLGERWLDFTVRGTHRVLAERGGFVVFAQGNGGQAIEIADSRRGDMAATTKRPLPTVHEGISGGARYPSAHPDDDGDGAVDEDRLDGVDNDGDGLIDEDYAAIGDEMIATTCRTPEGAETAPNLAASGQQPQVPAVELHQECYGWSLSHLDGMIAVKLTVTNTGDSDLTSVRVGMALDRHSAFEVGTQDIGAAVGDATGFGSPLAAKAMVLRDGANSLGLVFASEPHDRGEVSWITGVAAPDRRLVDIVRAADRPDALTRPDRAPAAPVAGGAAPDASERPPDTRVAYGLSPDLGTLAPGQSVDVYFALVAAGSGEREARAVDDAYRTLYGDGQHRLIPPPLSITRRVLWGTYELRVPDDPSAGVSVTLSDPRAQGIDPLEIASLRGLDVGSATRAVSATGDVDFEFTGTLPDDIRAARRTTVEGRTQGGEPFEVVLVPLSRPTGAMDAASVAADAYWSAPGKLDEALLSSSPNPFREATTVDYEVPARIAEANGQTIRFSGSVQTSVKVYNVAGRLVDTLIDTALGPGRYSVTWEARDESGSTVASGVYYLRLQIGKKYITKRLTQIR